MRPRTSARQRQVAAAAPEPSVIMTEQSPSSFHAVNSAQGSHPPASSSSAVQAASTPEEVWQTLKESSVVLLPTQAHLFDALQSARTPEEYAVAGKAILLALADQAIESDFRASCLLYTSPSPRDGLLPRMPSSA